MKTDANIMQFILEIIVFKKNYDFASILMRLLNKSLYLLLKSIDILQYLKFAFAVFYSLARENCCTSLTLKIVVSLK